MTIWYRLRWWINRNQTLSGLVIGSIVGYSITQFLFLVGIFK